MSKKLDKFLEQSSKDLKKNKYFIGGLVGGIFGAKAAGKGERAARDALSEALGMAAKIRVPTVEEQKIQLEMLKEAGILTPEMEAEILQDPAKLTLIMEDPALKGIQLQAMESLARRETAGLTPESRAALNQVRAQQAQQEKASREAILQNMAARGVAGGGQELAAQLAAQQGAAQTAAAQGDQIAAQADRQALEALIQRSAMAGQVREADLAAQSRNQEAQNVAQRFNTELLAGREQRNVGARNVAQAQNLANKQRVMDENVNLRNQQEIHNKALIQQQFENELAKTGLAAGLKGQQARMSQEQGYARAGMYGNIGQSVDKGAQSVMQAFAMSDITSKTNIKSGERDLENFLNEIQAKIKKKKYFQGGSLGASDLGQAQTFEGFNNSSPNQFGQAKSFEGFDNSDLPPTSVNLQKPELLKSGEKSTDYSKLFSGGVDSEQKQRLALQKAQIDDYLNSINFLEGFKAVNTPSHQTNLTPVHKNNSFGKSMYSEGGVVEGKAKRSGDHEDNDVVPAALSPGEIVIPRSAVKKGRKGIDDFLDQLEVKKYKYKDPTAPGAGSGEYVSPMAQDLEKSELGKDMVINTPNGKMVDYGKGFGTLLASQALLKEKIDDIEKKLKSRKK